jgi:hypothetical protein
VMASTNSGLGAGRRRLDRKTGQVRLFLVMGPASSAGHGGGCWIPGPAGRSCAASRSAACRSRRVRYTRGGLLPFASLTHTHTSPPWTS